jgi:NAD(P)-dependent dehydrogenase (short-subunit alcohol dehydrogenase family)
MALAGQVALVTGAARGIGLAIVRELAAADAVVVAGVRDLGTAGELEQVLQASGARFQIVACDVASDAQVGAVVAGALAAFGRIDALINNAGVINPIGRIGDVDPAAWAANLHVNLVGALRAIHAVLPHFVAQGSGTLVNISSGAAGQPLEGWSAYCAAKAGLAMLTRSVALEYGPQGVRSYGLRPGVVDTDMQATIRASGINQVSRLRREDLADPRGPARVVAWLCGADAADLAGQELDIRDPELRHRAGLEGETR